MADFVIGGEKSFTAGAAIAQYLRVKLSSGKLAVAGLTDEDLGVTLRASFASGDFTPVRLRTAQGTIIYTAVDAISQGAKVYSAASGKVSATQGTNALYIGLALQATSANGDLVEVLPV